MLSDVLSAASKQQGLKLFTMIMATFYRMLNFIMLYLNLTTGPIMIFLLLHLFYRYS